MSKIILHTPEFIIEIAKRGQSLIRAQYNKILREAFESTIDVLGYSGKICMIHELEDHGAYSTSDDTYLSLWKIGNGLKELFGQDIAELIMEGVMIRMDKLCAIQNVGRPHQQSF